MKFIPSRDTDKFKTAAVIQAVAGGPHKQKIDEMRRRCRILDAVEKAPVTGILIEDADHDHLVALLKDFDFGVAHAELLAIIDAILEAKAPPAGLAEMAQPNGEARPN